MVDLTLFHDQPDCDYTEEDRFNSRTGRFACYFLEWIGWYNGSIASRLLGHYRLYQLYKKDPEQAFRDIRLTQAYILHYRSSHRVKYLFSQIMSLVYCIATLGKHHFVFVEIETLNRSLIYEHAGILQTFLEQADHDFTNAFHTAMAKLNERILSVTDTPPPAPPPPMIIQFHKEDHHYQQTFLSHYSYNHTEINFQPVIQSSHKGKEKDVSKTSDRHLSLQSFPRILRLLHCHLRRAVQKIDCKPVVLKHTRDPVPKYRFHHPHIQL